jgi:hypothetical protein
MHYDSRYNTYTFVFESEEWEPVPFSLPLPELRIQCSSFHVLPLLERAETILAGMYRDDGDDVSRWLAEWRELKGEIKKE